MFCGVVWSLLCLVVTWCAWRVLCAGAAIAAAVLDHLAHTSHCCGLFATHYHQLAAEHAADPQVAIMHMACAVAEQQQEEEWQGREGDAAEVTFLYKLTQGAWKGGLCWRVGVREMVALLWTVLYC